MNKYAKISRRALAALSLGAALALGSPAGFAKDVTTLRFGTFVGPTSFLNAGIFKPWFQMIEEETGGAVKIEFLPGGSAAKAQDVMDAVRAGIIDIGWSISSYNPGRFNAAGVVELPLLASGPAESSAGMAALYERGLLDGFGDVKVIGIGTSDVARLHHAAVVSGLSGFKGAKVRAAGSVLSVMIEKIGATPVGMPISTVAESLAKKVIDGAAADWFSLEGFRLIDVTKTHMDLPMGAAGMYLVMNKAKYDQLPGAVKAVFEKHSVREFSRFWGTRLQAESNRVRDMVAAKPGHKIVEPSAEDTAVWNGAAGEVIASWSSSTPNSAAILDVYRKGIDAYRAAN